MTEGTAVNVGARLREARENKGVSLRQIATTTRISMMSLEALERNDLSRLPGGIFTRAFIRAYAEEVGLDPEGLIQDFIAQFPSDSVAAGTRHAAQAEDHQAFESDRRALETAVRLVLFSLPIAAVGHLLRDAGTPAAGGPGTRRGRAVDPAGGPRRRAARSDSAAGGAAGAGGTARGVT